MEYQYIFDKPLEDFENPLALFGLASSNGDVKKNTFSNDVVISTLFDTQRIHIGPSNNGNSIVDISKSNVYFNALDGVNISTCNNIDYKGLCITNSNSGTDASVKMQLKNNIGFLDFMLNSSKHVNGNLGTITNTTGDLLLKSKDETSSYFASGNTGFVGINNLDPKGKFHVTAEPLTEYGNMIIESSNLGGIGGKLNIKNSSIPKNKGNQSILTFQLNDTQNPYSVADKGYDVSHASISAILNSNDADFTSILFASEGREKMRLSSDGFLGIGTTEPITNIHAKMSNNDHASIYLGGNNASGFYINKDSGNILDIYNGEYSYGISMLRLQGDTKRMGIMTKTPLETFDVNGNMKFRNSFANTIGTALKPSYSWYTDKTTGIFFDNAVCFSVQENEICRFTTNSVGIGTTTPISKLDIRGNVLASNQYLSQIGKVIENGNINPSYSWYENPVSGLFLDSINNVGLVTNGIEHLRIDETGDTYIKGNVLSSNQFLNENDILYDTNGKIIPSYSRQDDKDSGLFLAGNDNIGLATNGIEHLRIDETGDTYLNASLHVSSNITFMGNLSNNNPDFTFHVPQINLQSENLRVDGNIKASGDIYTSNNIHAKIAYLNSLVINGNTQTTSDLSGSSAFFETLNIEDYIVVNSNVMISNDLSASNATFEGRLDVLQSIFVGSNLSLSNDLFASKATFDHLDVTNISVLSNATIGSNLYASTLLSSDILGDETVPAFSFEADTDIGMYRPTSKTLGFSTSGIERMRILPNGKVGINIQNPDKTLDVLGDAQVSGKLYVEDIILNASDSRVKTNITRIENPLSKAMSITGCRFNFTEDFCASNNLDQTKLYLGVIAQDVEKVLPEIVNENNGIKNVSYIGLIPMLIESVKELYLRIEQLENNKE